MKKFMIEISEMPWVAALKITLITTLLFSLVAYFARANFEINTSLIIMIISFVIGSISVWIASVIVKRKTNQNQQG